MPVIEQKLNEKDKDFRKMVGTETSKRPIRVGAIDRARVLDLLGDPAYRSADGRAIGYSFNAKRGVWVWPLCFTTQIAKERVYVLRLIFGEKDILQRWDIEHADGSHDSLIDNSTHWQDDVLD